MSVDDFGVPVFTTDLKANLGFESLNEDAPITDQSVLEQLKHLHTRFNKLGIDVGPWKKKKKKRKGQAGEGDGEEGGREENTQLGSSDITFKRAMGMINKALHQVYGMTLQRTETSSKIDSVYTLQPSTLKIGAKKSDPELDFAWMGFLRPPDPRVAVANQWIRLIAGQGVSVSNDDDEMFNEGGEWVCSASNLWPVEEAAVAREASLRAFNGMCDFLGATMGEVVQNKRIAQMTIKAVYGGRAEVDFRQRRVKIQSRGPAPTLSGFGVETSELLVRSDVYIRRV